MRLDRLELKGLLGFPDPVTLDLRDVPPGLVAIVGKNGAGKTTVLDAGPAGLYLAFPSREGPLFQYATDRAAYIDTLWSIEGHGTFRARVNIDGVRRQTDAVLEQTDAAGLATLNDGKVSTFKAAVAERFAPKDLLLASAFAAQNRAGSLVTLDRRGQKDLFSTLLGLRHYERMAETARACAQIALRGRAALLAARDLLAREAAPERFTALAVSLAAVAAQRTDLEARRRLFRESLEELAADRDELVDQVERHIKAEAELAALLTRLGTAAATIQQAGQEETAARATAQQDLARAHASHRTTADAVEARAVDMAAKTAKAIADLAERIAGNETLTARADEIRAAATADAAAEVLVGRLQHEQSAIRTEIAEIAGRVSAGERRLGAFGRTRERLEDAHQQAQTLADVPCRGAGPYAACQFLVRASEAAGRLPALEQDLVGEADVTAALAADVALVTARREDLGRLDAQVHTATQQRASLKALASYEPELAATEARIAGYRQQVAHLHATAQQAQADRAQQILEAAARREEADHRARERCDAAVVAAGTRRAEAEQILTQAEGARVAIEAEVSATRPARARLDVLDVEATRARAQWTETEVTLARCDAEREACARQLADAERQRARLETVTARLDTVTAALLEWQLFVTAFSRDGLPTLEIDAAGPTVSNLTNDLLSVCFGTRFTVDVVTQVERADGKGLKEDFSIQVFDNEAGGLRDIGDLSGGERVIVEEALCGAVALFRNSRNEMPIRTCWRDETTGALDAENTARYIAMLRRIQDLGGFQHILFITHNADAAASADTQVRVADGRLTVVRPPYSVAA